MIEVKLSYVGPEIRLWTGEEIKTGATIVLEEAVAVALIERDPAAWSRVTTKTKPAAAADEEE